MILTDALIDDLHAFRIGMMARSAESLKASTSSASGKAFGGGYGIIAGNGSPLTQVYGVGHRGAEFDLAEIDEFYKEQASNWELIVTPFDSQELLQAAAAAGYVPDHFESVLAQIADPKPFEIPPNVEIEEVVGDQAEWMIVSDAGWGGRDELADKPSDFSKAISAYPARRFLARVDGKPAAAAALGELDGRYLFSGACTRPQFRGRGLQKVLTQHRIHLAGTGALVQVVALPGSQSHRNLQRIGFQPLYSKLVMYRHG